MTARRRPKQEVWEGPTIPEASMALCEMFPAEWVREVARETGLVKRERVVDPVAMLWVMALSFGVGMVRRIEMLRHRYEQETGDDLGYASFYERFTPELVRFLKACAARGMQELAKDANRVLDDKLSQFVDILIQDSTVIRVHAALAGKWPATRSRKKAAGVKLATRISAVANGPTDVRIYGERTSESKTMHVGSWVKGSIALFDLGFYKHQMFARIEENGGFFVSRLKENSDPLLVASLRTHRGQAIELAGKRWSEVRQRLKREIVDSEVELAFPRRAYRGRRSGDTMKVRLVGVYNEEAGKYHTYLTNIQPDVLAPEEIGKLYGARWEVEMLFKEMKRVYALDGIKTKNPQVVEALIWTGILTLIMSRKVHNMVRRAAPPEVRPRLTQLRWAGYFLGNAHRFLPVVLEKYGIEDSETLRLRIHTSQALDPHLNRRRFTDGVWG